MLEALLESFNKAQQEGKENTAKPKKKHLKHSNRFVTSYYQKFIPEYASVAAALTDLMKKAAPNQVLWNPECDRVFQQLKLLLCLSPVLRSSDFSTTFYLTNRCI